MPSMHRRLGALYAAWKRANRAGKQRIVAEPLLVIRALAAMAEGTSDEGTSLHKDLSVLATVALRAGRRAREGGDPAAACCTRSNRVTGDRTRGAESMDRRHQLVLRSISRSRPRWVVEYLDVYKRLQGMEDI